MQHRRGSNKLAVGGGIIVEPLTIKAQGRWPDYVFKPAYQLSDLNEIKEYIDKNHHLPEIPSEAEIEKNGQNLGEMNRLLLKKVEELTLYMMEFYKEVQQLNNKRTIQEKANCKIFY